MLVSHTTCLLANSTLGKIDMNNTSFCRPDSIKTSAAECLCSARLASIHTVPCRTGLSLSHLAFSDFGRGCKDTAREVVASPEGLTPNNPKVYRRSHDGLLAVISCPNMMKHRLWNNARSRDDVIRGKFDNCRSGATLNLHTRIM